MASLNNFKAEDVLYGRNGSVILGGTTLLNVRRVEARVRVDKATLRLAKQFQDRHRRIGWNGNGTLQIYRINSAFFREMLDSIDPKSKMPVFRMQMELENNDADRSVGYKEFIDLLDVKFWDYDWMFDVENFVELPLGFTFEDIKWPNVNPQLTVFSRSAIRTQ